MSNSTEKRDAVVKGVRKEAERWYPYTLLRAIDKANAFSAKSL